jgi:hypothetical protein
MLSISPATSRAEFVLLPGGPYFAPPQRAHFNTAPFGSLRRVLL